MYLFLFFIHFIGKRQMQRYTKKRKERENRNEKEICLPKMN